MEIMMTLIKAITAALALFLPGVVHAEPTASAMSMTFGDSGEVTDMALSNSSGALATAGANAGPDGVSTNATGSSQAGSMMITTDPETGDLSITHGRLENSGNPYTSH